MKSALYLMGLVGVAGNVLAATGFYAEAGVSYAALNDGYYSHAKFYDVSAAGVGAAVVVDPTQVVESTPDFSPFVAAGYRFGERCGLRASYRYIGKTEGVWEYQTVAAGSIWSVFSDEVHVVTLAPELRWRAGGKLTFTVSPELNWVISSAHLRTKTNNPAVQVLADQHCTEKAVTVGGAAAVEWTLGQGWMLVGRYQFTDLDPSWKREAHIVSAALRCEF